MAAKRDPNEEMMMRLLVGNSLLTIQLAYGRTKPRIAKLAALLNRDINLKWDEYMEEIYGPVAFAAMPKPLSQADVKKLLKLMQKMLAA